MQSSRIHIIFSLLLACSFMFSGYLYNELRITKEAITPQAEQEPRELFSKQARNIYRQWAKTHNTPIVQRNLTFLTNVMDARKIPSLFLSRIPGNNKRVLDMLYFNPKHIKIEFVNSFHDCKSESPTIFTNANREIATIKCAFGNQMYMMSDADEIIDDSWGDDIVFPGKGSDELNMGWGTDVIVLEKNWGQKTISKTCQLNAPDHDSNIYETIQKRIFYGLGLSYKKNQAFLYISEVVEGGPADKAGLVKGDSISEISAKPISQLSLPEITGILDSADQNSVKILYTQATTGQQILKTIEKDVVDFSKKLRFHPYAENNLKVSKIDWPYKYDNFLIFGPGIDGDDLRWVDEKTLINIHTNDKIFFKSKPCFEFIYTKNIALPDIQISAMPHGTATKQPFTKNNNDKQVEKTKEHKLYEYQRKYKNYWAIADVFQKGIKSNENTSRKKYFDYHLKKFEKLSHDTDEINSFSLKTATNKVLERELKRQRASLLDYDLNVDGKIPAQELKKAIEIRQKNYTKQGTAEFRKKVKNKISLIMQRFDLDKTGIIEADEIVAMNYIMSSQMLKNNIDNLIDRYNAYLQIDPITNFTNSITKDAFINHAREAFYIYDLNQDGVISVNEAGEIRNAQAAKRLIMTEHERTPQIKRKSKP